MTTMDEQQEAKRRKLEALEAKMGGAPPPQAVRPAKMPNLPAVAPTPASSAPTAADASEEQTRSPFVCDANDVVQFHLRDAHTAREDLELALRERTRLRERLRGALLFSVGAG